MLVVKLINARNVNLIKEKRYFHRFFSGLTKCIYQGRIVRFGTLTSSDLSNSERDIGRDFDVLVKRIRRKVPHFECARIIVLKGGRWHIHFIFSGAYIPQGWLSEAWNDVHGAVVVDIRMCRNIGGLARYMITQYLSGQDCSYTRMSYSRHWLFPGAVVVWKELINSVKRGYYFEPVHMRYFKHHVEVRFSAIMDIILMRWNAILYRHSFTQLSLSDYG